MDTSVFGGAEDPEFAEHSRRFFGLVQDGLYVVLISAESMREMARAPEPVRARLLTLSADDLEEIPDDPEIAALAEQYVRAGVLGPASISDALHVSAASVAGADLMVSWNFRHIVNFNRICGFNGVNVRLGYRSMTILSPREVTSDDEDV